MFSFVRVYKMVSGNLNVVQIEALWLVITAEQVNTR